MEEHWKPVVGYEGLYEVSDQGNVKSIARKAKVSRIRNGNREEYYQQVKEHVLKFGKRSDGYKDVPLSKDGITSQVCVHRLVAEAFLPNPENKKCVNHIDGDKRNNHVSNLEWTTYLENNIHAVYANLNTQAIPVYCDQTGESYPSMHRCEEALGIPEGTISNQIKHPSLDYPYTFKILAEHTIRR